MIKTKPVQCCCPTQTLLCSVHVSFLASTRFAHTKRFCVCVTRQNNNQAVVTRTEKCLKCFGRVLNKLLLCCCCQKEKLFVEHLVCMRSYQQNRYKHLILLRLSCNRTVLLCGDEVLSGFRNFLKSPQEGLGYTAHNKSSWRKNKSRHSLHSLFTANKEQRSFKLQYYFTGKAITIFPSN